MTDPRPDGGSGDGSFRWRWLLAVPVLLLALLAVAYWAGIVGQPTAGVAGHEWGTVTDDRIEVLTTVWVNNPNPFGAQFGDGLTVEYDVVLNGVTVATGSKTGIDVPAGNSTERLRTTVDADRLPAWWVAFLRDNGTVRADVEADIAVDVGPTVDYSVERERTMLADERPVLGTFSGTAERLEGTYTTTFELDEGFRERLRAYDVRVDEVTVGYEVRRGWATFGSVTEEATTVVYHFRVHNPGDVPVPATPRGVDLTVEANDVRLFESDPTAVSLRNASAEDVIRPGETREVTFAVTMDNEQVDDWFTSHVRRGERSTVTARLRLVFDHPFRDQRVRLPVERPITYDCGFRTAILVDREAGATCGEPANATAG